jgi:hypothetical protein
MSWLESCNRMQVDTSKDNRCAMVEVYYGNPPGRHRLTQQRKQKAGQFIAAGLETVGPASGASQAGTVRSGPTRVHYQALSRAESQRSPCGPKELLPRQRPVGNYALNPCPTAHSVGTTGRITTAVMSSDSVSTGQINLQDS